MKVYTTSVEHLTDIEWEVNDKIEQLTNDGHEVINVQYMDKENRGYGMRYYIMILYK